MVRRRRSVGSLVVALGMLACGGVSSRDDGEGSGGSPSAGSGGSTSAGSGGSNAGRGGDISAGSGGAGAVCTHNGVDYPAGATFPAGDGCNTCTCSAQGHAQCTLIACNVCPTIESEYAMAHSAAKACNPELDIDQCSQRSSVGLACACETFLNPANADAEARLRTLEAEYASASCASNVLCGACREPLGAICGADGFCRDVFDDGSGSGGASGVLDKCPESRPAAGAPCVGTFSCNYDDTCNCGVCCFSTYACRDGSITFLGSNDGCYQIPC